MAKMAFQVHLAQMVRKVFQVTPRMALQESQGTGDCQDPLGHREQGVIQAFLGFKVWATFYMFKGQNLSKGAPGSEKASSHSDP